ncbi:MAG: hypothetical protein ACUVXA_03025 [Candidatus Jordarchaeum sp.]|uniref:hypothetical protein n=1 Tax=Candidatus Jordarchaeum sp. TaxID=2823881 RepID=UPI00404A24C4
MVRKSFEKQEKETHSSGSSLLDSLELMFPIKKNWEPVWEDIQSLCIPDKDYEFMNFDGETFTLKAKNEQALTTRYALANILSRLLYSKGMLVLKFKPLEELNENLTN